MAENDAPQDAAPKKRSKLPLLIGLVLMLIFGGGAFYAMYSGLILSGASAAAEAHGDTSGGHEAAAGGHGEAVSLGEIAFVPIPPLVISLPPSARATHLRFTAQLEVDKSREAGVTQLLPRVLDVLNSYLRAVSVADLEDPSALIRLRAQMLRRIQIVTGPEQVRDLLVTDFVLN